MLKKTTHRIDFDDEILHSIELIDREDRTVSYTIYENGTANEKRFEYDDEGNTILEVNREDGIELDRCESRFDAEGRILWQRIMISDELFEEAKTEYSDQGFERITHQDDMPVQRLVHTENGEDYERLIYFEEELSERQVYTYNSLENSAVEMVWDENGVVFSRTETWYTDEGDILLEKEFNEGGGLIREWKFERKNGLLIKEWRLDFSAFDRTEVVTHEYDAQKNLIRLEVRSSDGHLLEFIISAYDDKNRPIEEKGSSTGHFDSNLGSQSGSDFHFVHRYEEME